MKKLIFGLCLLSSPALAARVIQFDLNTNVLINDLGNIDENPYLNLKDYMIFTEKTIMTAEEVNKFLFTIPIKYLKKDGDPHIVEMSQAEKDAVDAQEDLDRRKNLGASYKNRIETDLLVIAMIEQEAKAQGAPYDQIVAVIEQSIATALGLPNL